MIRKAKLDDLIFINDIYNYEVINTLATFDTVQRNYEKALVWYNHHNDTNRPIFVYELDKKVVGFCSLSDYRQLDAYAKTVEISLYVDKDSRGLGIGKQLAEHVLSYAKDRADIHNAIAVITSVNQKSINLFKKLDFQDGGTIKDTGFKFNQTLSITNLYKIV